ncbi:MAG: pseudouridine synthase [Pseudomonadota bacterium]
MSEKHDNKKPTDGERVAKVIARAGVASRREAEALIGAGRVKVNGVRLETPATVVTPSDVVEVDGAQIPRRLRTRAWLFNKPKGYVTTNRDPQGRPTVFDALPKGLPRVVTVGRLDINTEGLLVLTNDGGLARVLELPATGWIRKYRARVHGAIDEAALSALSAGTAVDGVLYGPIEVHVDRAGDNSWLTISLTEGKNREIKVVLGSLGLSVTRLIRVSFGPFQLGDLPRGGAKEIPTRFLKDQLGPRLSAEAQADFDAPLTGPAPTVGSRVAQKSARSRPVRTQSSDSKREPRPPRAARKEASPSKSANRKGGPSKSKGQKEVGEARRNDGRSKPPKTSNHGVASGDVRDPSRRKVRGDNKGSPAQKFRSTTTRPKTKKAPPRR